MGLVSRQAVCRSCAARRRRAGIVFGARVARGMIALLSVAALLWALWP